MARPHRSLTRRPVAALAILAACLVAALSVVMLTRPPAPAGPAAQVASTVTPPATLTAVDLVSPSLGWVAGYTPSSGQGQLLSSQDGGARWQLQSLSGVRVLALDMSTSQHGAMLAETGCNSYVCSQLAILSTTASGSWAVRWKDPILPSLLQNLSQLQGAVLIERPGANWALAGGLLLTSPNGALSWHLVQIPAGLTPTSLSVVGKTVVVAAVTPPQAAVSELSVLSSQDGGAVWHTLFHAAPSGGIFPYSAGVSFANAKDGWLYYKNGATWQASLWQTKDGGRTWSAEAGAPGSGRTVSLAPDFVSPTLGWLPVSQGAAPFPGGLYVTSDGGAHWTGVGTSFQNPWSLQAVSLLSSGAGWAVIDQSSGLSVLAKTTDGGREWQDLLPALRPTAGVAFTSATNGVGIGSPIDSGAVLVSHDGGQGWRQVASLPADLTAVSAVGGNVMVSGQDAALANRLLLYTGTAQHLRLRYQMAVPYTDLPAAAPLIHFFSPTEGVWKVFGFPNAVVLKTRDGGSSWQPLATYARTPGTWDALEYLTPTGAVLATQLSASAQNTAGTDFPVSLSASASGGSSWQVIDQLSLPGWMQAMDFLNPNQGWLLVEVAPLSAHPSEWLYATTDGGVSWQSHRLSLPSSLVPLSPLGGSEVMSLDFATAKAGWIVSGDAFLRTTDGGQTWQVVP